MNLRVLTLRKRENNKQTTKKQKPTSKNLGISSLYIRVKHGEKGTMVAFYLGHEFKIELPLFACWSMCEVALGDWPVCKQASARALAGASAQMQDRSSQLLSRALEVPQEYSKSRAR